MKVGDYVRTIQGYVAKIEDIENGIYMCDNTIGYVYEPFASFNETNKEIVVKSSPNIIDLIEVGDYVNGLQVYETGTFGHNGKTFCRLYGNVAPFYEEDIKSIVTKEQFESMEYKLGEK